MKRRSLAVLGGLAMLMLLLGAAYYFLARVGAPDPAAEFERLKQEVVAVIGSTAVTRYEIVVDEAFHSHLLGSGDPVRRQLDAAVRGELLKAAGMGIGPEEIETERRLLERECVGDIGRRRAVARLRRHAGALEEVILRPRAVASRWASIDGGRRPRGPVIVEVPPGPLEAEIRKALEGRSEVQVSRRMVNEP